jgi:hypothetical protein
MNTSRAASSSRRRLSRASARSRRGTLSRIGGILIFTPSLAWLTAAERFSLQPEESPPERD